MGDRDDIQRDDEPRVTAPGGLSTVRLNAAENVGLASPSAPRRESDVRTR
jgi:hypothetical protein